VTLDAVVVGAGAIGSFLAVELHDAGRDVVLCSRSKIGPMQMDEPSGSRLVDVPVATQPSQLSEAQTVFVATKAQDTESARPWVESAVGAGSTVVFAQNGIDHAERLPGLPSGVNLLPAIVIIAAERVAPGHVQHRLGNRLVLPDVAAAHEVVGLFAGSGIDVRVEPDFLTENWRKLVANCAANPITALTLRRFEVLHLPEVRDLALSIVNEVIMVGRACGADLGDDDITSTLARWDAQPLDGGTSMLFDRLAKRSLEHEYLLGPVVRHGRERSVPTPVTEVILTLLRAAGPVPGPVRPGQPGSR
jgi:2-dehydropantoate 2-reductase